MCRMRTLGMYSYAMTGLVHVTTALAVGSLIVVVSAPRAGRGRATSASRPESTRPVR